MFSSIFQKRQSKLKDDKSELRWEGKDARNSSLLSEMKNNVKRGCGEAFVVWLLAALCGGLIIGRVISFYFVVRS